MTTIDTRKNDSNSTHITKYSENIVDNDPDQNYDRLDIMINSNNG